MKRRMYGFTIVELVVVVAVIVILMAIAWSSLAPMGRRNEVLNNMRYVRAAVTRARAKAIEYTQPVRLTYDFQNRLLIERDPTRDGDWSDAILEMGQIESGSNVGDESPFPHVKRIALTDIGAALPHWTGLGDFGNAAEFAQPWIVVYPDGTVLAGNPLVPASGTWFLSDDRESFYGAVHVTAMGEVKMAYSAAEAVGTSDGGPYNGWFWTD